MRWFSNFKIATKLAIVIAIVMLISVGVISIKAYITASSILDEILYANLQNRAKENAVIVENQVEKIMIELEDIAFQHDIQSMDWSIQKETLQEEIKRLEFIRMGIVDINGIINITDSDSLNISNEEYFQKALAGETYISDPFVSSVDDKLVVVGTTPIKNSEGRIIGVLEATFDYTIISNVTNAIKVGETGYAFAINKQGTTVFHPNSELVINKDNDFENVNNDPMLASLVELEKKMVNGETGIGTYSYNKKEKFMAYAPIPGTRWSLALSAPKADFFKDVYMLRTTMIIISIIALLIGIAIIIIIANILIKKPIRGLVHAAEELAKGSTDIQISKNSKDEIGQLIDSFSRMTKNINEQAENARKIAQGDLSITVIPKSEKDVLAQSMKLVVETLKGLEVEQSIYLEKVKVQGELTYHPNFDKFNGTFKNILKGTDDISAELINTLTIAINYLNRIGSGNIPQEIKEEYSTVSWNGGDVTTRWVGDYDKMRVGINNAINAIRNIIDDITMLSQEAVEGRLSTRADVTKYSYDYAKIIAGINGTLDAVIEPIQEASEVLQQMAKGNLSTRMIGDYQGDHAEIKNALNFTGENIQGYIDQISDVLRNVAEKNLTVKIKREYLGDFIKLKDSINFIIEELNTILSEINASSEQVEAGADQVAAASQNLSHGAAEQAGSVEEIGATVTQVAEQTKENAENANQANELSIKAKTDAQNGNTQMAEMLKAMNEIKESSKSISNIIKVIDEIAFQTNILALNAAVEAARAGEHGKGFAVVAEEVRNLAARSAKAAKETTDMIDNSINKVEEGYTIANDTADALNNIVTGVTDAVEIVGMIANASSQQASAIAEINQGIEQISQVTQSNTATAEESASASEEMAGQAQMLKGLIQEFKLNNSAEKLLKNTQTVKKQAVLEKNEANNIEISLDEDSFGKY